LQEVKESKSRVIIQSLFLSCRCILCYCNAVV